MILWFHFNKDVGLVAGVLSSINAFVICSVQKTGSTVICSRHSVSVVLIGSTVMCVTKPLLK